MGDFYPAGTRVETRTVCTECGEPIRALLCSRSCPYNDAREHRHDSRAAHEYRYVMRTPWISGRGVPGPVAS